MNQFRLPQPIGTNFQPGALKPQDDAQVSQTPTQPASGKSLLARVAVRAGQGLQHALVAQCRAMPKAVATPAAANNTPTEDGAASDVDAQGALHGETGDMHTSHASTAGAGAPPKPAESGQAHAGSENHDSGAEEHHGHGKNEKPAHHAGSPSTQDGQPQTTAGKIADVAGTASGALTTASLMIAGTTLAATPVTLGGAIPAGIAIDALVGGAAVVTGLVSGAAKLYDRVINNVGKPDESVPVTHVNQDQAAPGEQKMDTAQTSGSDAMHAKPDAGAGLRPRPVAQANTEKVNAGAEQPQAAPAVQTAKVSPPAKKEKQD